MPDARSGWRRNRSIAVVRASSVIARIGTTSPVVAVNACLVALASRLPNARAARPCIQATAVNRPFAAVLGLVTTPRVRGIDVPGYPTTRLHLIAPSFRSPGGYCHSRSAIDVRGSFARQRDHGDVNEPHSAEVNVDGRLEDLNRRFYSGDPAAYFRARIVGARALVPDGDGLTEAAAGLMDTARLNRAALAKHAAIDSQVILHHVAEAVLRVFMSHRHQPACPWLQLAGVTNVRTFRETVTAWNVDPQSIDPEASWVFLGSVGPRDDTGRDSWERAARNANAFLHRLASTWLDENHLYNSMKHGLAVTADDAVFQVDTANTGNFVRLADGMAIEHLETVGWNDDDERGGTSRPGGSTLSKPLISPELLAACWNQHGCWHGGDMSTARETRWRCGCPSTGQPTSNEEGRTASR